MTDQPRRRCPHPGVAHDPHDWTDTRQMTWRCPGTPVTDPAPAGRDVDPRPYLNHPGHEHTAGHHATEATRHVAALHEAVGRLTVERDTLAGANEALQRGAEQLQRELSEEIRRTGNATEEIGRLRASISERNERHTRELDARAESLAILKAELADVRLEAMAARTGADRYRAVLERIRERHIGCNCDEHDPDVIDVLDALAGTAHGSGETPPQTPETPAPVPEAGPTDSEAADRRTAPDPITGLPGIPTTPDGATDWPRFAGELRARPRSCPTCHSIGARRPVGPNFGQVCDHPWHGPIA